MIFALVYYNYSTIVVLLKIAQCGPIIIIPYTCTLTLHVWSVVITGVQGFLCLALCIVVLLFVRVCAQLLLCLSIANKLIFV